MKIDFTGQEYRLLIDMLEIASWVLESHQTEEPLAVKKYSHLVQKMFSFANAAGCGQLIEFDEDSSEYCPTEEYDKKSDAMQFIEEFEDNSFWENLAHRMSIRDLVIQEGDDAGPELTEFEDKALTMLELEGWYEEEFLKNGLDNLKVDTKPVDNGYGHLN